jgi:hypothetical protein
MSQNATHQLIAFTSVSSEAATKYVQDLNLPNLRQILSVLTLVDSDISAEDTFSPPHERALARAQGLPIVDGYIPWAAQRAAALGLENAQNLTWSFVTLCHSVVGMGSMTMEDPVHLNVSEAESRQLFADMMPYFAEDGLTLHYLEPKRWLCSGEPLHAVRTASFDRVIGKNLSDWQPVDGQPTAEPPQGGLAPSGGSAEHAVASVGAQKLRRLQNEMQMLLYTHTVNDARSRSNTSVINSVYFHGNGQNETLKSQVSTNITPSINMTRTLADAALKEDWPAWVKAWEQLDATVCADLLKRVTTGEAVVLTLCGERSALRYELRQKTVFERIKGGFRGVFGIKPAYLLPKQL